MPSCRIGDLKVNCAAGIILFVLLAHCLAFQAPSTNSFQDPGNIRYHSCLHLLHDFSHPFWRRGSNPFEQFLWQKRKQTWKERATVQELKPKALVAQTTKSLFMCILKASMARHFVCARATVHLCVRRSIDEHFNNGVIVWLLAAVGPV